MYRPRLMPVLLLKDLYLVKTLKFRNPEYIGDPINAVRIFNQLNADEIIFLDISSKLSDNKMKYDLIERIAYQANMPFSYGGDIHSLEQISEIIKRGAEKIIFGSATYNNPNLILEASEKFGASTIACCLDYKKLIFKKNETFFYNSGSKKSNLSLPELIKIAEDHGAGEIIFQDINRDGSMKGFDYELPRRARELCSVPFTVMGGAGSYDDIKELNQLINPNGIGVGSKFIYLRERGQVLINYPNKKNKEELLIQN